MFLHFFLKLREVGVPVTLTEYLTLLRALAGGLDVFSIESFYHLARTTLVKDERFFDRFDLVFSATFGGAVTDEGGAPREIPSEWLRKLAERLLSPEELERLAALDLHELMETLKKRLAEQRERHQGGSKWIGTGGTSPFGAYGSNPAGVRVGQEGSRLRRAVKVWDRREFENLDGDAELGPRNLKMALRRLRRFAREGANDELDLDGTIGATAKNAGHLDLRFVPERRNAARVLLLLDVGGSMDVHVREVEDLFRAARSEFKHLEPYYFHNCVYERVWRDNRRRWSEATPTSDVMNTYGPEYRLVLVGDASMSPYELAYPFGSVEHENAEPGLDWLERLRRRYAHHAWLNPVREEFWSYTHSIGMVNEAFEGRMFPLTLDGVSRAVATLNH